MSADPAAQFAIRLIKTVSEGKDVPPKDVRRFAFIIGLRTATETGAVPDRNLKHSVDAPGYLARSRDDRTFYIPFNLAPVFPGDEILADLCPILRRVQVDATSVICISGSTTFLGRTQQVVDLDFCEYYVADPAKLPESVVVKTNYEEPGPLARVKTNGREFHHPFPALAEEIRANACGPEDGAPARPLKLDFIQNSSIFGAIAASNVVLPIDAAAPEAGNASRSFVYQEAVVIPIGTPLRELLEPGAFIAYLNWLRGEIKDLLNNRTRKEKSKDWPIKALKRCLSLYLALGIREDSITDIISELNHGDLTDVSSRIRAQEVTELSALLETRRREAIRANIRGAGDGKPVTDRNDALALKGAARLAQSLLDELELLIERAAPLT